MISYFNFRPCFSNIFGNLWNCLKNRTLVLDVDIFPFIRSAARKILVSKYFITSKFFGWGDLWKNFKNPCSRSGEKDGAGSIKMLCLPMKKHCGEAIREFELHNKQTTEQLYTLGQSLSRSRFYCCRAYNYGLMHTHTHHIHC